MSRLFKRIPPSTPIPPPHTEKIPIVFIEWAHGQTTDLDCRWGLSRQELEVNANERGVTSLARTPLLHWPTDAASKASVWVLLLTLPTPLLPSHFFHPTFSVPWVLWMQTQQNWVQLIIWFLKVLAKFQSDMFIAVYRESSLIYHGYWVLVQSKLKILFWVCVYVCVIVHVYGYTFMAPSFQESSLSFWGRVSHWVCDLPMKLSWLVSKCLGLCWDHKPSFSQRCWRLNLEPHS